MNRTDDLIITISNDVAFWEEDIIKSLFNKFVVIYYSKGDIYEPTEEFVGKIVSIDNNGIILFRKGNQSNHEILELSWNKIAHIYYP